MEVGERTFAVAWRWRGNDVESVLLSLDDRGALRATPVDIPYADPLTVGAEPDAVRLLSTGLDGTTRTVRVRLDAPGGPSADAAVRVAGVLPGWPQHLVSDGRRAWLVQSVATPDRSVGGSSIQTIDLASARVVASEPIPAGSRAACDARGCAIVAGPAPDPSLAPRDEALPRNTFLRSARFAHHDGVIEVSWSSESGMTHSPTDAQGRRRYYPTWHFEGGEVSLLRIDHGVWTATDVAPLPLRDVEGTMHDGYEPLVLRNGLHAAVLLLPLGGRDPAWFQPYRAPCPPPTVP